MPLRRKRFDRPDEVRVVEKARVELVELGELAVGRAIFEPGWRWSEHVKPIVGTVCCQVHHIGFVVSGHLHVEMTDGASLEVVAGDAFEIPPGHDAWVVGNEPWVSVDWAGRRLFAKSPNEIYDRIFATLVFTDLSGSTETLTRLGGRCRCCDPIGLGTLREPDAPVCRAGPRAPAGRCERVRPDEPAAHRHGLGLDALVAALADATLDGTHLQQG
jgi:quercetin dioxygenase-like cupin family protein